MKMSLNNEIKTGIFVVICLVAFGALAAKVGNFTFTKKGYILKTKFHFTGGVKKHAPVCLSGVEVGEVKDIRLLYDEDTVVELDLWIQDGIKIRLDSKSMATTLGLMGEKYIEIKAGAAAEYAKNGDRIAGEDPFRMEELVDIGKKVAGDISKTTQDIGSVARHVDEVIVENRPKIGDMLENFDETSENFRDFSEDVKYHPWKVLLKGREVPKAERDRARAERLAAKAKLLGLPIQAVDATTAPTTIPSSEISAAKANFKPANHHSH